MGVTFKIWGKTDINCSSYGALKFYLSDHIFDPRFDPRFDQSQNHNHPLASRLDLGQNGGEIEEREERRGRRGRRGMRGMRGRKERRRKRGLGREEDASCEGCVPAAKQERAFSSFRGERRAGSVRAAMMEDASCGGMRAAGCLRTVDDKSIGWV
jgi:hypothetical protein